MIVCRDVVSDFVNVQLCMTSTVSTPVLRYLCVQQAKTRSRMQRHGMQLWRELLQ